MKTAISLLLALAVTCSAQAADWRKIGDNDEFTTFFDRSSVQHTAGGKLRAWRKQEYKKEEFLGKVDGKELLLSRAVTHSEYDCTAREIRRLSATFYNKKGKVVGELGEDTKATPAIPDSLGFTLLHHVCIASMD